MWGTTSTGDELAGNFAGALEDLSIGDRRLFRRLAENYSQGILGLLQHYRHFSDLKFVLHDVPRWGEADMI